VPADRDPQRETTGGSAADPIHVLHIGKTGGTALKAVLAPFAAEGRFVLHGHATRCRDCPPRARIFFVVRHPVDRFVSAFNSRLRKGRPRFDNPWSLRQAIVFSLFRSPNALAEGLGSRNPLVRLAAGLSMRAVGHLRRRLSYWIDAEQIERDPRLIVGTLETLAADLRRLLAIAGIEEPAELPTDPVEAHVTPAEFDRSLSAAAVRNLTRYFRSDIALYEACLRAREATRFPEG
jgi:Sulfotransferase family